MTPTISGAVRSKTVYLGAAVAVVAFLQGGDPAVFEPLIPAAMLEAGLRIVGTLLGLAVIAVRFVTDAPLAEKVESKQGGFASPYLLAAIAAGLIVGGFLASCTGTRAAYREASNPGEYAYVVADHYNALVNEAADLRESGALEGEALARIQAADRAAKPLVLKLRPLAEAYAMVGSAENEAALQAALNEAVRQVAEFVRLLRAAQGQATSDNVPSRSPVSDQLLATAAAV